MHHISLCDPEGTRIEFWTRVLKQFSVPARTPAAIAVSSTAATTPATTTIIAGFGLEVGGLAERRRRLQQISIGIHARQGHAYFGFDARQQERIIFAGKAD